MNPFSVVSNLPFLYRQSTTNPVNVVVHTPASHKQQQPPPNPPHATVLSKDMQTQQVDQIDLKTNMVPRKHRNNPQAILPELDQKEQDFYLRLAAVNQPSSSFTAFNDNDNDNLDNEDCKKFNRHSIHMIPSTTATVTATTTPTPTPTPSSTPPKTDDLPSRQVLIRHSSSPIIHTSAASKVHAAPARASIDSYERAKIIKPSPADTVQATVMISQPRPPHLRHMRSSSSPNMTMPTSISSQPPRPSHLSSSTLASPSDLNTPVSGTNFGQEEPDQDSEDDKERGKATQSESDDDTPQTLTQMQLAVARALKFAESQKAPATPLATPPTTPTTPMLPATSTPKVTTTNVTPSIPSLTPPVTPPITPVTSSTKSLVEPTASISTLEKPCTPLTLSQTSSTVAPTPTPTVATPPSPPASPSISSTFPSAATSSSFLASWQGRPRTMISSIPRPSPLMPFRAARSVVNSVTSVGTGLIPSKEQLGSLPVAGRILKHPVMDSTLSYIATKASERGISLHALTGGIDPKTLISPEDVPYRKLNKKLIQQAMTLSVLAMEKEDQSKAMDDEAGDDAFELYLAAINIMLHALPFETCDPLRREAFETQLRDFLEDQLEELRGVDEISDASVSSKRLRRRCRRRHRQNHELAATMIQQHTAVSEEAVASMDEKAAAAFIQQQRGQQKQKQQQRKQRREQHAKELQALKKQQQEQEKELKNKKQTKLASPSSSPSLQPTKASPSNGHTHSRRRHTRRQRHHFHEHELPQHNDIANNDKALQNPSHVNNAGGIGDAIISTAVHSAIRLKQSPIPDVVKSCLRTSKTIFHKVDERFHLQDKAWELSKQSIEKAIELDEQYAIHEAVTETVFATLTGLVKAGIAYKETPGYAAVKAAQTQGGLGAAGAAGTITDGAAAGSNATNRSHHPQEIDHKKQIDLKELAKQQKRKRGSTRAALAAAAAAAVASTTRRGWSKRTSSAVAKESDSGSSSTTNSEADSEDSDFDSENESDSEMMTPSTGPSSCPSSDMEETSLDSDKGYGRLQPQQQQMQQKEEVIELNQQTLLSPTPSSTPYTDQVREKIDMFMALKGAASLIYGNL
ncbi:hypothetical protein BX616_009465 [Lobosporangium transversale]|uniref:Uncharacterized protein n=1 Tax=Lobosporangium transversale TaxID=64571 RepID=A0A1Y2GFN6_9FUNG|nr:hypothetical protein BCR41DRAFT_358700 [Lobosporangium transversale]KAF9913843.1 hypothetical protein BX616_009465 [Lobosporangium transversale]ORZ09438.1 hypothetical protein BCR41DRAFT_358700 [Lobosporangium transversale]|eukprot:XP_021878891.1 hypothetical protein BCR41DRAFT_358700 [Lobosporangium transversale]